MGKYVVAVKRKISYGGQVVPPQERQWYFAQYDKRGNTPDFYSLRGALMFESVQQAEAWFRDNIELIPDIEEYDLNSLQIQSVETKLAKKINYYKPKHEINWLWG